MANYLTISRILLIFPVLILASPEPNQNNWIALVLFVIAGITDHLDGYIARRTKTVSSFGGLLDLIADKLLICLPIFYLLSFSNNSELILPSLLILSRELIISSLRQFIVETIGHNPIHVTFLAKIKTTSQIIALSFLIISPNFGEYFYYLTILLFWLAAYLSLHSIIMYARIYKKFI